MLSNHSPENLEMCKDWFYMVTSLLKITRFTIISKSKGFWIHPRLQELGVYKKFLQEVYCCFEIRKTLWVAKDKRHLLSCLMTLHETPSQLDSWRNFWDLQPENETGNLFSFDAAAIDGWEEPQLLWCWKLPVLSKYNNGLLLSAEVFIISFGLGLLQERVIVTLLCWLHCGCQGNINLCALLHWQYILNLQSSLSSLLFFLHYDL